MPYCGRLCIALLQPRCPAPCTLLLQAPTLQKARRLALLCCARSCAAGPAALA